MFIALLNVGIACADIRITEIAWMGTADSQYGEWFELYNDGAEEVNLAGWKLYEDDGAQLVFTFSKKIPSKTYFLIERTTASSPDPVPGIDDESGSFGGSGFANTGENLVLKDAQGTAVQSLLFASGWPAGDAETKKTMQWDGAKWITAIATPKASLTVDTGGGGVSTAGPSQSSTYIPPKYEPRIDFSIPKTIYATVSFEGSAKTFLESGEQWNGLFLWNMGDGKIYKSQKPELIRHTYQYPGVYTISFAYYKNPYDKKPTLSSTVDKTVISPKVTFTVLPKKGFQFTNTDTVSVDLSGWVIVFPGGTIELPPLSIVGAKRSIIMPFSALGVESGAYEGATFQTPERTSVSGSLEEAEENKKGNPSVGTALFKRDTSVASAVDLEASVHDSVSQKDEKQKNHTKEILFGVVLLFVVGLFIVAEKFVSRKEE